MKRIEQKIYLKMKILSIFSITTLCLFLYLKLDAAIAQDVLTRELQLTSSFPEETDKVIFAYPTAMEVDENGNIFICDQQLSSILKYDKNGRLFKEIGRAGQGPGEFTQQSKFCYDNEKLYVVDQANRRIQILNSHNGEYISSFKTISIPFAISHIDNKLFTVLLDDNISGLIKKPKLVTIFNESGKILGGFGEYLAFVPNLTKHASHSLLKIHNKKLYVLFRYYPLLRIYSIDGELTKTIEFTEQNYSQLIPGNYEWENFKRGSKAFPFKFLFNAFDVNEHGIFLGLYDDDIIIDRYDFEGEFQERYLRKHQTDSFYLVDFRVIAHDKEKLTFYILNIEELPKLDICIVKDASDWRKK